jgi:hypothetical protein
MMTRNIRERERSRSVLRHTVQELPCRTISIRDSRSQGRDAGPHEEMLLVIAVRGSVPL